LGVADGIASRYRHRGESFEDLKQTAYEGLVKAVRRFDPALGHDFLDFAVPTIAGEVKRYFRDCGWVVRPPRRVQETQLQIMSAADRLAMTLHRTPTCAELADHLGIELADVVEALTIQGCFSPLSLDVAPATCRDGAPLHQLLGGDDGQYQARETVLVLQSAIDQLPKADRHLLRLYVDEGWTQQQIGHELGLTQVTISRRLTRIRNRLRRVVEAAL